MESRRYLINRILVGLDSGAIILDGWKFRYNSIIKGIEAYNNFEAVVESQISNENFEKVAERLLTKLGY